VFFVFLYGFALQPLMQRFLSLGTDCVKIQETFDASKGFSFAFHFSCFVSLFAFLFLIFANIISLLTVALATALTRVAALEAELKTSTEALKDANTAKVSAVKAAKAAEARAKKAEKALAKANQRQSKREQAVVGRLDEISSSVGSKCFTLSFSLC
jgi:ABC-type transport system involved in cytochrome bd biosynthesis fused ATPase/permease subunit